MGVSNSKINNIPISIPTRQFDNNTCYTLCYDDSNSSTWVESNDNDFNSCKNNKTECSHGQQKLFYFNERQTAGVGTTALGSTTSVTTSDTTNGSNNITAYYANFNENRLDLYKKQYTDLANNLEASLKTYILFNNYENKNEVIIKDLNKKLINQDKEVKDLAEDKDKIKTLILFNKNKLNRSKRKQTIFLVLNIVLLIAIIIIVFITIKKLKPYILSKYKPSI
jgi:ABC-type antimicrobial peptide transport system permease subunit